MKKNLTKADLVKAVYNKIGYSKKLCEELVEDMFNNMKESLKKGQGLKIQSFGKFILKDKKSRRGRNPQTGKALTISARRVLLFHASSVLKQKF